MARSRINQKLAHQTQRNVSLLLIGVVIFLVLALFFGVKLLVNFSLFVEKKNDPSLAQSQEQSFVSIPSLDPINSSTNSATIDITGTADGGKYIKLFVNGKLAKKADIKGDHTFAFRNVSIESGDNEIKARAVDENNKESRFSDVLTVTYSNKPPDLSVDFPTDGQTYHKDDNPLKIRGKSSPSAKVTVNDFWAIVDSEGNFHYNLSMKGGDNEIKIVATDEAGNKTEKTLHITYSE